MISWLDGFSFHELDSLIGACLVPLLAAYLVLGIDDFLLDAFAWARGLFPQRITELDLTHLRSLPRRRIAIVVASWKESDVIARMVHGNQARIEYDQHWFFLGVYPNDPETMKAALELAHEFSNVRVVVNSRTGPTSKGQMINEIVDRVLADEEPSFDAILIHDSEDLIHPHALLAANEGLSRADFLQIPVFSLPLGARELVGGVYMDEFAESHCKDLRVRAQLCGSIPAAGVGMVISRWLLKRYLAASGGRLFNASSMTEDYEMGLTAKRFGAKSELLYARTGPRPDDIVATRAFFPRRARSSIRQKTRWSLGIVFQSWRNLGWSGSWIERFFLYRDRKAPVANAVVLIGFGISLYILARRLAGVSGIGAFDASWTAGEGVDWLFGATSLLMINRVLQRVNATAWLYGWGAALGMALRLFAGNFINAIASLRSFAQYMRSLFSGRDVKWAKTEHELPAGFGLPFPSRAAMDPILRASASAGERPSVLAPAPSRAQAQAGDSSAITVGSIGALAFSVGLAFAALLAAGEARAFTAAGVSTSPRGTMESSRESSGEEAGGDGPHVQRTRGPCVRVYYDASSDPGYKLGEVYSLFLRNLLGHFPAYQQIVEPIENYRGGDLEHCKATIYIGSYFENAIPAAFFDDLARTNKNVAWLGYSVWKLGEERLKEIFGAEYRRLTILDSDRRDPRGRPTFFREVLYKGEVFPKYGEFRRGDPGTFLAPFEMVELRADPSGGAEVLAQARHDGTGEVIPYILRKRNRFYVADVPFSFMHEADRYLVFADLLFDILGEKPVHTGRRPAVFRLEDIHSKVPQYQVYDIVNQLARLKVPFHIALIPIFHDPLFTIERRPEDSFVMMHQEPHFLQMLDDLERKGASFIWHGVTHQYKNVRNPHDAFSGNDFEFWDAIGNRPVVEDSLDFVLGRLQDGWYTLEKSGIRPRIWEVPHYQASALDYMIFARLFSWNIGRAIYFLHDASGVPTENDPSLWYETSGLDGHEARVRALSRLRVEIRSNFSGQMFPFEIYGDVYGQRLFPENLGNPQPFESDHVIVSRSVDEILLAARRNLKLRDQWGSLFFHPQLVSTPSEEGIGRFPGDTAELARLVNEMTKMGYEFVDLEKFVDASGSKRRPQAIVKGKAK